MIAFSESGLTIGEVAGMLGVVFGELVLTFGSLALILTNLQPSWQSIAGAAVILAGLALVMHEIAEVITAISDSGLSMNEMIASFVTILGTLIGLIAALTIAANLLQSPTAMGGLVVLTASIVAILSVMALTLPTILGALGEFIVTIAPVLLAVLDRIFGFTTDIFNILSDKMIPAVESLIRTLRELIERILKSILDFIVGLGRAINSFVDDAIRAVTKLVNFIISAIEYMVNTLVVGGINKIINGINSVGEYIGFTIPTVPNFSIERFVPRLATGAVIPPNSEFLAVLGDQKRGTNIEAPLDTIKQALAEVYAEMGGGQVGNIEVPVYIDSREAARAVRSGEEKIGSQTVFGGFANAY